ncbi:MAG: hypothetical protein RSD69_03645 [Bacilli bacterium]
MSWKYLLREKGETTVTNGLNYTLGSNMNNLIINMEENMKNAKLNDLHADGFLTLTDASLLKKKVLIGQTRTEIGTLSMTEFITAVAGGLQ